MITSIEGTTGLVPLSWRRLMKRVGIVLLALIIMVALGRTDDAESSRTEEVVLDVPGGHPVAILLSGASRTLGEEKNGFVKVTIEGWLRLGDGRESQMLIAPPPVTLGLSGQIRVDLSSGEARYGAGARVMLLGRVDELEQERTELVKQFEEERTELAQNIVQMEEEAKNALNSSNNFREATAQRDRTLATMAAREKELHNLSLLFRARLDELFARHQVATTLADEGGHYFFPDAKAGRYHLLASFTRGETSHRWYLPLDWSGIEERVVDLTGDGIGTDPYRAFQGTE
jgi:hypothetical protein